LFLLLLDTFDPLYLNLTAETEAGLTAIERSIILIAAIMKAVRITKLLLIL
jgi:hypothetical protein